MISNSDCNNAYGAYVVDGANLGITENMVCAADASGNGGSDACQVTYNGDVGDDDDILMMLMMMTIIN